MTTEGQGAVPAPGQPDQGQRRGRSRRRRVPPPKDPTQVAFLCDAMFGRLARELRQAGIDCEHDRNLGGMAAYRVGRQRGRIVITRANRLRELPGVMFMQSGEMAEQVAQVQAAIAAGLAPAVPVDEPRPEPRPAGEAGPAGEPEAAAPGPDTGDEPETGQPELREEMEPAPEPDPDGQEAMAMLSPLPLPLPNIETRREPRPEPRPQQRDRGPRGRRDQRDRRPQHSAPPAVQARPAAEPGARCPVCNMALEKITREQARPVVPFFTYQIHHDFRRCPKCRKVYWPGSHVAGARGQADSQPAAPASMPRRYPRGGRGRRGPRR